MLYHTKVKQFYYIIIYTPCGPNYGVILLAVLLIFEMLLYLLLTRLVDLTGCWNGFAEAIAF